MKNFFSRLLDRRSEKNDALFRQRFDTAQKLGEWGDHASAIRMLEDCAAMRPDLAAVQFYLGENLAAAERYEDAIVAYGRARKMDEGDALGAGIKLALLGAEAIPQSLPEDYVRSLFDQFAPSFDKSLVGNLGYNTPDEIANAVFARSRGPWNRVLDLGCGTGLSAAPFRALAARIDGVDLSGGMLAQAKRKNLYDALHQDDIVRFLSAPGDKFNLVLCVDTLVYIGVPDTLFRAVRVHMRDDALFAFSVQKSAEHELILGRDQRYSHGEDYIRACAGIAGLRVLSCDEKILRREYGQPVPGLIFLCAIDRV